ncbi:protein SpAN-like, partial [Saccostrea cucullata]|uniref:protein SpAN-like n=1 Tax=Saccostrea cuccullata TaxID=36930 RepID=UPI002ED15E8A
MNILVIPLTTALCFEYGLTSNILLENINTKKGQFTSPEYPANYPDNANYTWIIWTGHTAANVTFRVHDMNIKFTNPCDDYLEIKEIDQCCFTAFKRCGELKDWTLVIKGNQIRVSFISDRILNAKGFSLSWTVTLPPTTPRPKVTKIRTTIPSKTSVRIYPTKLATKLTTTSATSTASTTKKLTAKKTITTEWKIPLTRELMSAPTTRTFSMALQMTTSPMKAKTYGITTMRPTLASNHFSGTYILRSLTLPVCFVGISRGRADLPPDLVRTEQFA